MLNSKQIIIMLFPNVIILILRLIIVNRLIEKFIFLNVSSIKFLHQIILHKVNRN